MFESKTLILIGYWYSKDKDDAHYPDPKNLIDEAFYKANWRIKNQLSGHLFNGVPCNHYRGYSGCRICGERLGTFERTDGIYVWPDKLEHYIEVHNVRLPEQFINHVMSKNPWVLYKTDDSFWLESTKSMIGQIK
jgi:hypothetical protein